jgi:hypothetical protein
VWYVYDVYVVGVAGYVILIVLLILHLLVSSSLHTFIAYGFTILLSIVMILYYTVRFKTCKCEV